MEIKYLNAFEVLIIHVSLVEWSETEGNPLNNLDLYTKRINDKLLDSALNACKQPYYSSLYMKAAALFRSLLMNHTFPDGNKRTATISLLVFLLNNGYDLNATDDEIVKFALRIARGYERNIYAIKAWIKRRMVKVNEQSSNFSHKSIWEIFKSIMEYFHKNTEDN